MGPGGSGAEAAGPGWFNLPAAVAAPVAAPTWARDRVVGPPPCRTVGQAGLHGLRSDDDQRGADVRDRSWLDLERMAATFDATPGSTLERITVTVASEAGDRLELPRTARCARRLGAVATRRARTVRAGGRAGSCDAARQLTSWSGRSSRRCRTGSGSRRRSGVAASCGARPAWASRRTARRRVCSPRRCSGPDVTVRGACDMDPDRVVYDGLVDGEAGGPVGRGEHPHVDDGVVGEHRPGPAARPVRVQRGERQHRRASGRTGPPAE